MEKPRDMLCFFRILGQKKRNTGHRCPELSGFYELVSELSTPSTGKFLAVPLKGRRALPNCDQHQGSGPLWRDFRASRDVGSCKANRRPAHG
jgi:hypothetical protein